jgi:hypothetical protein
MRNSQRKICSIRKRRVVSFRTLMKAILSSSLNSSCKEPREDLSNKWNACNVPTRAFDRDRCDHSREMGDHTLPVNTLTDKNTLG